MAAPVGQLADRSIGELLHDLSEGTSRLVRQEIRLAKTESVESILELKHGSVMLAMGGALALCAGGAAVACLILVLAEYVFAGRSWLAALVVAVVLGVIGLIVIKRGVGAIGAAHLAPRETATSIKETAEWLKHPTKSAAS